MFNSEVIVTPIKSLVGLILGGDIYPIYPPVATHLICSIFRDNKTKHNY